MKQLDFSPLYTPMSESEVQWFRQYYQNFNVERKPEGVLIQVLSILFTIFMIGSGIITLFVPTSDSVATRILIAPMQILVIVSFVIFIVYQFRR